MDDDLGEALDDDLDPAAVEVVERSDVGGPARDDHRLPGNGFRLEVPADRASQTLRLYVGIYQGTAALIAVLSDGSARAIHDESLVAPGCNRGLAAVWTLTYRAGSDGQRLRSYTCCRTTRVAATSRSRRRH